MAERLHAAIVLDAPPDRPPVLDIYWIGGGMSRFDFTNAAEATRAFDLAARSNIYPRRQSDAA